MILLRPNGIHFDAPGIGQEQKYTEFPTIDTGDELWANKPYKHTGLIRSFVLRILRNRNYSVWERLVILGMYCDQLSRMPVDELLIGTPVLTQSFEANINESQFSATLGGISANTGLLLNVVISSMEDRISSEYTSPRFVECYRQFIEGIGFEAGIETKDLAERFENVRASEYERFFENREYIWENFLVSKAHKDVFPLGPQNAVYLSSRSIYQEFVVLAFQYIFARTLMVGLSGHFQSELSEDHVITLIQSFSRSVEHNPAYLNKILLSFERGQIANLPILASLLRS
jgi:lysine-N-methylase